MKIFLITLLAVNFVYACPNLEGNYICANKSNTFTLNVTQNESTISMNRSGIDMQYFLDGRFYDIPSTEDYTDAKYKSSCSNDSMIVDFEANILYQGSIIAHQVSKTSYSKQGEDLIINIKTKMKKIPLPKNIYTCKIAK